MLPVKQRKSEKQSEPREIANGNSGLFRPMVRRRETLAQQLAWIVAEGTEIDITVGKENTKWVQPETVPERIAPFACDKEKGAMKARRDTDRTGEMSL